VGRVTVYYTYRCMLRFNMVLRLYVVFVRRRVVHREQRFVDTVSLHNCTCCLGSLVSSKRTVTDIFLYFLRFTLKTDTAYKMQLNDNYNDMKMKNVKEEEPGGIYSNAFLPFSQNRLKCRYGFSVKHGSIGVSRHGRTGRPPPPIG